VVIRDQNKICPNGLKQFPLMVGEGRAGRINKIISAAVRVRTPSPLLGIARSRAYTKRKYHSGWICSGVTRGLAGIKFSGSPRR